MNTTELTRRQLPGDLVLRWVGRVMQVALFKVASVTRVGRRPFLLSLLFSCSNWCPRITS